MFNNNMLVSSWLILSLKFYIPYNAVYRMTAVFEPVPSPLGIYRPGLTDGGRVSRSRHMTVQLYGRTRTTVRCAPLLEGGGGTKIYD